MKKFNKMRKYLLCIFVLIVFLNSCSVQKKHFQRGYTVHWNKQFAKNDLITNESLKKDILDSYEINQDVDTIKNSDFEFLALNSQKINQITDSVICDNILLTDGEEIQAKIIEISNNEIKYKRCDHVDGPTIILEKKKIFMITYSNGKKEIIKHEEVKEIKEKNDNANQHKSYNKKINGFALSGFILSLIGIPIIGLLFSLIGLDRIQKNPDVFSGEGFAITGIVISLVYIAIILLIISI